MKVKKWVPLIRMNRLVPHCEPEFWQPHMYIYIIYTYMFIYIYIQIFSNIGVWFKNIQKEGSTGSKLNHFVKNRVFPPHPLLGVNNFDPQPFVKMSQFT